MVRLVKHSHTSVSLVKSRSCTSTLRLTPFVLPELAGSNLRLYSPLMPALLNLVLSLFLHVINSASTLTVAHQTRHVGIVKSTKDEKKGRTGEDEKVSYEHSHDHIIA